MEAERSTILLLKEVVPNNLVGLEVMPGLLPPNLKSKKALAYIQKLAKDPRNDHDATLTLKESASQVRHKPSAQGCTMTFQELESIQHKLAEAPGDATLSKLELTPNEIMHFVIKQIRQAGYFPHNIDNLEKSWAAKTPGTLTPIHCMRLLPPCTVDSRSTVSSRPVVCTIAVIRVETIIPITVQTW